MMRCIVRLHYRDYKISHGRDDGEGICSNVIESDPDGTGCFSAVRNGITGLGKTFLILSSIILIILIAGCVAFFFLYDLDAEAKEEVDLLIDTFNQLESQKNPPDEPGRFQTEKPRTRGGVDQDLLEGRRFPDTPTGRNQPLERADHEETPVNNLETRFESSRHKESSGFPDISRKEPAEIDPATYLHESKGDEDEQSSPLDVLRELNVQTSSPPPASRPHAKLPHTTDVMEVSKLQDCSDLQLPLCARSMPWVKTSLPNWVNDTTHRELDESLVYFQSILVGSRCSPRAAEYTCALLEPPCGSNGKNLPPCKAFCQAVFKSCSEFLVKGNHLNSALECGRFPDSSDPDVCVDVSPGTTTGKTGSSRDKLKDPGAPFGDRKDVAAKTSLPNIFTTPPTDTARSVPADFKGTELQNADEATSVFICELSKFLCTDGSDCLTPDQVCDGISHCLDNSDESNCNSTAEAASFFLDFEIVTRPQKLHLTGFSSVPPRVKGTSLLESDLLAEFTTPFSSNQKTRERLESARFVLKEQEDSPTDKLFFSKQETSSSESRLQKRPSLSEILSESAIVAVPLDEHLEQTADSLNVSLGKSVSGFQASTRTPAPKNNGLTDSTSRNTRPRTTERVVKEPVILESSQRNPKLTAGHSKKSLASLLSTSHPSPPFTSSEPKNKFDGLSSTTVGPRDVDISTSTPATRRNSKRKIPKSLSELLSALPPSSSASRIKSSSSFAALSSGSTPKPLLSCPEIQCIDGTCISMSQINNGVKDCSDGSDERVNRTLL